MIEDNSGWENFLHSACAGGNVDNVDVSNRLLVAGLEAIVNCSLKMVPPPSLRYTPTPIHLVSVMTKRVDDSSVSIIANQA